MRILLIEDEKGIAHLIKEGLEEANYTVEVARDGQVGLEMAIEQTYHLLLLDVMLPGRDGWSICEELRARRNQVPILMLTARDTVKDRVRGLDTGADDYLPKPFDFQELLASCPDCAETAPAFSPAILYKVSERFPVRQNARIGLGSRATRPANVSTSPSVILPVMTGRCAYLRPAARAALSIAALVGCSAPPSPSGRLLTIALNPSDATAASCSGNS